MSHLTLVPALPKEECRCDRESGRYWYQGAWNCKATDVMVRFYPTKGWHHQKPNERWLNHAHNPEEQAA